MKEERYFYVPDAASQTELPSEEAMHALRVLRLKGGDEMILMDGQGTFYRAVVTIAATKRCMYEITEEMPQARDWRGRLHIAMAPTKKAPVIYNNVELQQIMQCIADGYGVKVVFKNETARTLRFYLQWDSDDTLQDIIDRINHFEKVHLTLSDETITIE